MPARAHSFDGYVRISQTRGRSGESFQSPDRQWLAIENYAKGKEVDVVRNEPELDVSGSKLVRPILDAIMARIRCGESAGIIVDTVDRLSRAGLGDAIKLVEEIRAAGGSVGFAELDIDTVSEAGEFALNIWLSLAHMQWRAYQRKWATSRAAAVKRGSFPGPTPLGFDRNDDGTLTANADDAEAIWEVFKIAAADGLHAATDYLANRFPDGPRAARRWDIRATQQLLAREIYLGTLRHGDYVQQVPALALVSRLEWDLAQHTRAVVRRSKLVGLFPLAGIASCATCGRPLVAQTHGKQRTRRYRCINPACAARAHTSAAPLEALVLDAVRADPPTVNQDEMAARMRRMIAAATAIDEHLATRAAVDALGPAYVPAWEAGLADCEAELAAARDAADLPGTDDLPDLDSDLSPTDMRAVFTRALASCTISPGRGPLTQRVALVLS